LGKNSSVILALLTGMLLAPTAAPPPSAAVQAAFERSGKRITPPLLGELEGLAAGGDASAAQALGEAYSAAGGAADLRKACDYFEKAASARADSVHNLATCFFSGRGRAIDKAKARSLYQEASRRGLRRADCALGNMLIAGDGGPVDAARGVALCRKAAEAGDADAQADYGGHLLSGEAVAKNAGEARKWLTAAAEQDHANAALLLGKIYWNGDGTAKDNSAAARWWLKAYERGQSQAAFLLGQEAFVRLARSGPTPDRADPAILDEALKWFGIAAEKDLDPNARQQAATLIKRLLPFKGKLGRRN
jgi:uncharacterized protein